VSKRRYRSLPSCPTRSWHRIELLRDAAIYRTGGKRKLWKNMARSELAHELLDRGCEVAQK